MTHDTPAFWLRASRGAQRRLKSLLHRTLFSLRKGKPTVSPAPKTVICNVRGIPIRLEVESAADQFRAQTYESKEPETLSWIEQYFKPKDVFYDIGANIGLYSLFSAKHLNKNLTVYAFEPEALNYAKLNRHIFINNLSGVIVPCALALNNQLRFDTFYLHESLIEADKLGAGLVSGTALHNFGEAVDLNKKQFQPIHQQGMVGVPVDHLWQQWGLPFPTHLKIDVDGLEQQILEGATHTLQDPRLKSLLIELNENDEGLQHLIKEMKKQGFVRDPHPTLHSETGLNHIFSRQPLHS